MEDLLDELEERVAIIMEGDGVSEHEAKKMALEGCDIRMVRLAVWFRDMNDPWFPAAW